jgi:hypothetical protein
MFGAPTFTERTESPNAVHIYSSQSGAEIISQQVLRPHKTDEERREAVRRMQEFAEKNRTSLKGISIKELIHEGHRV